MYHLSGVPQGMIIHTRFMGGNQQRAFGGVADKGGDFSLKGYVGSTIDTEVMKQKGIFYFIWFTKLSVRKYLYYCHTVFG